MEKRIWFLDVSAERVDDEEQIWVWGLDEEGKPCVLMSKGQVHRFYVAFEREAEAQEAREKFEGVAQECGKDVSLSLREKRRFGRRVHALEVTCPPSILQDLARKAGGMFGKSRVFEDDIRFTHRFLLDHDVAPSSWYLASAEKVREEGGLDFYAFDSMKSLDLETIPATKIMGFDIVYYSKRGEADPGRDPVAIISLCSGDGEEWQLNLEGGEKAVLEGFVEAIEKYDPDVLVGFDSNAVHWNYLLRRAKRHGVTLGVGRLGSEPHQSLYGHFSVAGRINFDLRDYASDIAALERKTLEELASYLGIPPGEIEAIEAFLHSKYWAERRGELLRYSMWRARAMVGCFKLILSHVFSLSSITGMPADYVQTASPGFRLENYLMREATKTGELIPKPSGRFMPPYVGGKVLSPIPGLHRDIAVIDFKAMYPSLMVKHNVSPDTIVLPPFPSGENIFVVRDKMEVGIAQERKGFFVDILERIVGEREKTRQRMGRHPKDTPEYKLLDSRQKTLKVMANAMYGYMGWGGARWHVREGAMAVAALGRKVIVETSKKAEEGGLTVIYGDTDSLFIEYVPEKISALLGWIEEDLGLEAKLEKVYERVIFTEAKKRYAGLTREGDLDVVGLETVRRDWCDYARETQRDLLRIVLGGGSRDEALEYVRGRVAKLRRMELEVNELVIWEQITRPLGEYVAKGPHIAVAERLVERGWRIKKGDYVGYVITRGVGPLYTRAKHYSEADVEEIDREYYVEKQILPVCSRVVSALGVKMKELEALASAAGRDILSFGAG
ncbi:MAG: DNA-directed DNA polymerase [Candidatus Geothermarchaeales archaeon]